MRRSPTRERLERMIDSEMNIAVVGEPTSLETEPTSATMGAKNETKEAEIAREAGPAHGQDRRHGAGDAAPEQASDRDGGGKGPGECQD